MKKGSEAAGTKKRLRLWTVALGVAVVAILFRFALENHVFRECLEILQPITLGLIFAYLLNPLMSLFERLFHLAFGKIIKKETLLHKCCRGLAIFFSLVLGIGVVAMIIYMIIPELYVSISSLVSDLPKQIEHAIQWYNATVDDYDALRAVGDGLLNSAMTWVKTIDTGMLLNTLMKFTNGAYLAVKTALHVIVGIIVAIYVLSSKEVLLAQIKKCFYAFLEADKVNRMLRTVLQGHKIMSRFIIGKLIDSAIIGVLCFVVMAIFRLPYALLVSVVVGVTNVIPYFGPFIGAIPSAALILLKNPIQGLYFIVIIIIIQQLDGNLIGPKILGESTGLSPFWVMFAITLGGGMFGILGMLIGVPVLAILFFILREISHVRLSEKKMPLSTEAYVTMTEYPDPTEENHDDESV